MNDKYKSNLEEIISLFYKNKHSTGIKKIKETIKYFESEGKANEVSELKKILENNMDASLSGIEENFSQWLKEYYYTSKLINDELNLLVASHNNGERFYNKILLYGEPGTGKTDFVKILSEELGLKTLYVSYSKIISYRLGETLKNIEMLKIKNYDLIFFDEFDSIAQDRKYSNENREINRANIEIMKFIDEFPEDKYFVAATNLFSSIDSATIRRFDRKINFDLVLSDSNLMFEEIRKKMNKLHKKEGIRFQEYSPILKEISKYVKTETPNTIKKFFQNFDYLLRTNKKKLNEEILEFIDSISPELFQNLELSNTSRKTLGVQNDW